jgi:hypothetical protein
LRIELMMLQTSATFSAMVSLSSFSSMLVSAAVAGTRPSAAPE